MWGQAARGRAPWGADAVPNERPPGWQDVPPPIPDATATYSYLTQTGVGAWATRSWSGATATPVFPGGGISVAPDSDRGVMRLWFWWPDAPSLQVIRIGPDGTRIPVRGAYGVPITTGTRRNLCPNGSFEAGLNGYVQVDGNTTIVQSSTAPYVASGTYAMRMMSTTTTTGVIMPGTFPGAGDYTVAYNLGATTKPTAVTLTVAWLNTSGASAGSSALSLSADQLNAIVGQSVRAVFRFSAPATAVSGTATLTVTGIVASTTQVFLDAVMFERGLTSGDYFTGTDFGAQWTGVADLSIAILAPVQQVDDGECPFDIPVRYQVYDPSTTGGRMESLPVVLDSGDRTWLTHPADPSSPMIVQPAASAFPLEMEAEQGIFQPIGRTYPVVVSAAQRHSPRGTISFGTLSADERTDLLAMFADVSPVLMRVPAGYHPGDMWLSLGTLTIDPQGRKPWQATRILTAPFVEVEAPDPLISA